MKGSVKLYSIEISRRGREEAICYWQREQQVLRKLQNRPFTHASWLEAFTSGWLRQHGLGFFDHPSPFAHDRKLWEDRRLKEKWNVK